MMSLIALALAIVAPQTGTCETHRLLSGTTVQTCAGRVTARWDDAGNVRVYGTDGRIYTRVGAEWTVL